MYKSFSFLLSFLDDLLIAGLKPPCSSSLSLSRYSYFLDSMKFLLLVTSETSPFFSTIRLEFAEILGLKSKDSSCSSFRMAFLKFSYLFCSYFIWSSMNCSRVRGPLPDWPWFWCLFLERERFSDLYRCGKGIDFCI